jgi:6-pyruvoyltetrahydropterin/6-carboxytetrahydropterin synthase
MYEVTVDGRFSAAHNLRGYDGDCEHLHGHNYDVRVAVRVANLDELGLGIDFRELKKALATIIEELDHKYLNDDIREFGSEGMNPTTENLARFIFGRISEQKLPNGAKPEKITVWESPDCSVTYSRSEGNT